MTSAMTRKALATLTLLCACLVALPATASAASPFQIIKDCSADGVLSQTYSRADLRAAYKALDGDTKEYTDCDVAIRRALLTPTATPTPAGGTPGVTPSDGGGGAAPGVTAGAPNGNDQPTQFDKARLDRAEQSGDQPVDVGGVKLVPASGVRVDTSELPAPVVYALIILVAAGLAAMFPAARTHLGRLRHRR